MPTVIAYPTDTSHGGVNCDSLPWVEKSFFKPGFDAMLCHHAELATHPVLPKVHVI